MDLMKEALEKWGYASQRNIWIEELAELIVVLVKQDRYINPSFMTEILDEIADVDICMDQIKMIYPDYEKYKVRKMARLKRLVEVN